ASVQTAVKRPDAGVLSHHRWLGQSDHRTYQQRRRRRGVRRGSKRDEHQVNEHDTMGKVRAIQMTSSNVVAENLIAAGKLLREAKDAGADIACLPKNFAFIGLRDVDKQQ